VKLFPETPPPGPFRAGFWRSPLRGPWLTSLLGTLLLGFVVVVGLTGFLSHAAYNPDLLGNAIVAKDSDLGLLVFDWPTNPSWLYALNQGLHVTVGIITIPLLLAKLWSVIPRLFTWPPARGVRHAIERLSLLLLVGGALFEFATGVLNVQIYYPFGFNFVVAHYYGAWVFLAALTVHVGVKLTTIRGALRTHGALRPLRESLAQTRPETLPPGAEPGLIAAAPAEPTLSRRGLLALVGSAMGALAVSVAGQSIGGPLRATALLAPRRDTLDDGPNGFPVNKTARSASIKPEMVAPDRWRLTLVGPRRASLSRDDLLALPQHTEHLPIACVEGWSTTQAWTGVRVADLARMAGAGAGSSVLVESLQEKGVLRRASLSGDQWADERSLLALKVNGADLSMDHGFPARIIVPALPGVHNTKWVAKMTFGGGSA
jgi:DMSO/TMAO reductase YedYZ molybdopterin-dependent catalytic subunit